VSPAEVMLAAYAGGAIGMWIAIGSWFIRGREGRHGWLDLCDDIGVHPWQLACVGALVWPLTAAALVTA
jgi:hypothetical protein